MFIDAFIKDKKDQFNRLCVSFKVTRMYAFGSSASNHFNPASSDIDLLVEIDENDPVRKGTALMTLWNKLEDFFQKKVDLFTDKSIKNPFLKASIENSKKIIYERKG